jgi:hypothetical protein
MIPRMTAREHSTLNKQTGYMRLFIALSLPAKAAVDQGVR